MPKGGIQIELRAKKARRFIQVMNRMDMKKLHNSLGEEVRIMIQDRFDSGKDAHGMPFKPLKKNYTYRSGNQKVKRLVSSLPLMGGLGAPPLSRSFGFNATHKEVVVGTPVDYAKYHTDFPDNNGRPRRVIPLREFMGIFTDRDHDQLLTVVFDHVENTARAA